MNVNSRFNPSTPDFLKWTLPALNLEMLTDGSVKSLKPNSNQWRAWETAPYEPSHMNLHCLHRYLFWSEGLQGSIWWTHKSSLQLWIYLYRIFTFYVLIKLFKYNFDIFVKTLKQNIPFPPPFTLSRKWPHKNCLCCFFALYSTPHPLL